jgi:hypothetical protein
MFGMENVVFAQKSGTGCGLMATPYIVTYFNYVIQEEYAN